MGQAPGRGRRQGARERHTRWPLWGRPIVRDRGFASQGENVCPEELGDNDMVQQGTERGTVETQSVEEPASLTIRGDMGNGTRGQVARPQRTVRRPVWQEDFVLT